MTASLVERPPTARARLLGVLGAAALGFLGSPGVLGSDGSAVLAVLGVALWTATVVRPLGTRPGRALAVEWLAGGVAGGLLMWWVVHVVWLGVAYVVAGWGVYALAMGALLRRLRNRLAFPLAVALAWTAVEALRSWIEPPFGLGWLRLAHYAHDDLWLSGGARVVGLEGLGFALAAFAGGLAELSLERRVRTGSALAALAPAAIVAGLGFVWRAPETVDGPRVLLVQPGFEQSRKQHGDPDENFADSESLTFTALEELARRGEPPVDLVAWGESMLSAVLFADGLEAAMESGVRPPPWEEPFDANDVRRARSGEDHALRRGLLARLPAGTSLAAGAEFYDAVDGLVRRRVALALYGADHRRAGVAFKRHLVPLGETMFGLERYSAVRAMAKSAAGYVPDFVPAERPGTLVLRTRAGVEHRMSGTVCFDNAFADPYTALDQDGRAVDFHLVASNEAWYRKSCEMDQMVAFSRLIALFTGRSVVRATNSGISMVLGPDGRELGRVRAADGSYRMVAGWGAWTVPVPAPGTSAATPYVRSFRSQRAAWILLGVGAALLPVARRNRRAPAG